MHWRGWEGSFQRELATMIIVSFEGDAELITLRLIVDSDSEE